MKSDKGQSGTGISGSGGAGQLEFGGVGVSAGIALGSVHVIESGLAHIPEYRIPAGGVKRETARFAEALEKARAEVQELRAKAEALSEPAREEFGFLLDAHIAMLTSSRMVRGVERCIRHERLNAEAAVQAVVRDIARGFEGIEDPYFAARVQDVRDAGSRIIRQFVQVPSREMPRLPDGVVVVADELSPADLAVMDPDHIAAVVTASGGAEGHTAILARSMGLPAVLGVPGIVNAVRPNDRIIVDGETGVVIAHPGEATLAEYRRRSAAQRRLGRQLARLRSLPAETRDGTVVGLHANIELARDVDAALEAGAEGVGLLRTEFMFMNRNDAPGEDEQYAVLRTIVDGMKGRPVTIRTLDTGGENHVHGVRDGVRDGANPMLGLRAIRLSLRYPELLEIQIAAILRAGAHGPVRLLLPMISSLQQVRAVRGMVSAVADRLQERSGTPVSVPPLGVMIEVPGAALIAGSLADEVDFFAIGTNDLTMYTLAIDRGDEQVAPLYNPLHPAVLRLIRMTVEAAHRAGKPASVCGEIAGNPRFTPLLVGIGVRELSMTSKSIPRVKQRVRAIGLAPATRRAQAILELGDEGLVSTLLDEFNEAL